MEAQARITAAEERFEAWRQRAGLIMAPLVATTLWLVPIGGLSISAHRLLAVLGAVIVLWISEGLPLPVTALLGPAACVLVGVAPAKEVFRGFGDPILFLFLGGFLLAEAMIHHGLNRRIAFHVLSLPFVGSSPAKLLIGFGAVTAFLSMWISNTATTAMMAPIALAIISELKRGEEHADDLRGFAVAIMLTASFASSIGGIATPVGTPPNLIGIGIIEKTLGTRMPFFSWMLFALPLMVAILGVMLFVLARVAAHTRVAVNRDWLRAQHSALGPMSRAQKNVVIAFSATVALWIVPGLVALACGAESRSARWLSTHLHESVAALMGGGLLFVLPIQWRRSARFTLTWREAQHIDWGTILLFGGGLALGDLMFSTGLAKWIGESLAGGLQANTPFALVALFTAISIVVSETTSNAASATMVVPVAIAVAQAAGVAALPPALAACLGASMGFMLPVSTPPNAIIYGSGEVPLLKLMRYGVLLDVVGFVAIVAAVHWLVPLALHR